MFNTLSITFAGLPLDSGGLKKKDGQILAKTLQRSLHARNGTKTVSFCNLNPIQKARLARIRIAKASSGAAFVSKKKAVEAKLAAQESGLEIDDGKDEDIFELQHHHLLRCLEKTTVSQSSLSLLCPMIIIMIQFSFSSQFLLARLYNNDKKIKIAFFFFFSKQNV